MKKKGFTLIETLIVMLIISILISFAIPNYLEAKKTAQAAKVIADFEVIRTAVLIYYSETGTFPRNYYPGQLPPEIKKYLPVKFTFNLNPQIKATYDWENWVINGKPKHPKTKILYGISITTKDRALIRKLKGLLGSNFRWSLGNNYTFILESIRYEKKKPGIMR